MSLCKRSIEIYKLIFTLGHSCCSLNQVVGQKQKKSQAQNNDDCCKVQTNTSRHVGPWGPIYKESYARLMTAQNLRRTYAELVNCERLTKNHKLNLRKIYAKLTQNLGKTYEKLTKFIRFFVNRAPVPEMLSLQMYLRWSSVKLWCFLIKFHNK